MSLQGTLLIGAGDLYELGMDKNVYERDIDTSIHWVQDSILMPALGPEFFNFIISLIDSDQIYEPQYIYHYRLWQTYIISLLQWGVWADIEPNLHNKIRNAGLVRSTDEHITAIDQHTMYENMGRYEKKRDFYVKEMLKYICDNIEHFPEFDASSCGCGSCGSSNGVNQPGVRTEYIAGIVVD